MSFFYGGWGHLFDNGGSGYDIGRDALRYLLEAEEKRSSTLADPLFSLLLDELGASAHESIPLLYAKGKAYIASFAPIVFKALDQGSPLALSIINSNADAVAQRLSSALAEHTPLNELVCAGGLFNSPVFKSALVSRTSVPLFIPDCPPSLGLITVNTLCAAHEILIPLQCEFFALEGIVKLLHTYEQVRKRLNKDLQILGVLLTMYDGRLNLTMSVLEEIKNFFPGKLFRTPIPRSVRISEAPSHGLAIVDYERNGKGAAAYASVARELITRCEGK